MANALDRRDSFEDLLTCTICLEKFKVPKYLPCLHTFCKMCINTYILSTIVKEKNETSFKCPICRQNTNMEELQGNPETWADKLPGNHFVASMMDRQAMQKSEKVCDPCQSYGKSEIAISWCTVCDEAFCQSCERCHKVFKVSSKHKIISIREITTSESKVNILSSVNCDEHLGEAIKAYCVDHAEPLCTLCATLSHRKCDNVIGIEKAVSGIKESKKLSVNLNETSKQLQKLLGNRKDNLSEFERQAEAILQEITAVRESLFDQLKRMEAQIKDNLLVSKKEIILRLSEEVTAVSSFKSTIDNWISVLNTCRNHGSEQQFLVEMKKISAKHLSFNDDMNFFFKNMKSMSVKFNSEVLKDLTSKLKSFGEVKTEEASISKDILSSTVRKNLVSGSIKVVRTISFGCISFLSGLFLQYIVREKLLDTTRMEILIPNWHYITVHMI